MSGLRERNRRRTRQDIAEAALRLFDDVGFDATTIDQIAAAAGVSRSTFFRYFPTKEHALFPSHRDDLDRYRAALTASADDGHGPREAILAAARDASHATIDAFRRDPEAYRRRYRVIASVPSVQALGRHLDRDWEDELAEGFERHLDALGHDPPLQARLLAGSLMGTVNAFHRIWAEQGFTDDPVRYRDAVMDVFERGLDAATPPDRSGPRHT